MPRNVGESLLISHSFMILKEIRRKDSHDGFLDVRK